MISRSDKIRVLITSFLLTVSIFAAGLMANYGLDFVRFDLLDNNMDEFNVNSALLDTEQHFLREFSNDACDYMNRKVQNLSEEMRSVGVELSTYGSISTFNQRDFDYLKRRYFLMELKYYALILNLNNECDARYIPVIFFYDPDDEISERQGFILEDLMEDYSKVVSINLDRTYEGERMVNFLAEYFNVSSSPTLIIDNEIKLEGLHYAGELNSTILKLMRRADPFGAHLNFTNKSVRKLNNVSINLELDNRLIESRNTKNSSTACSGLQLVDQANAMNVTDQIKKINHITSASLGCGRNKKVFLLEASKLANGYEEELLFDLAYSHKLNLQFNTVYQPYNISQSGRGLVTYQYAIDNQIDPYNNSIYDGDIEYDVDFESIVVKKNKKWYASDQNGVYRFELNKSIESYAAARLLSNNVALITQTDNIALLVNSAINGNYSYVKGTCHEGAKNYLEAHGITVFCA